MDNKALRMIGLAFRAGKVALGEAKVLDNIRTNKACLVICACDASDNTKKRIKNASEYYNVKYIEISSKEDLGRYTGREISAVIAIMDENLAKSVLSD